MLPADPAARAGSTPEASGDSSSGTFANYMALLTESEFKAMFVGPMKRIEDAEGPSFDFWPYVDTIPQADYRGYDCSEGRVQWVWQTSDSQFEHILINTKEDKDVFMVVVIDKKNMEVSGHHFLDLKAEYGIPT